MGWGLAMDFAPTLHCIETLRVDDRRDSVWNDSILIAIFSQIPAVLEQRLETVLGERVAPAVSDATGVQRFDDAADAFPCCIPLECFLYHRGGSRVDLVVMLASIR